MVWYVKEIANKNVKMTFEWIWFCTTRPTNFSYPDTNLVRLVCICRQWKIKLKAVTKYLYRSLPNNIIIVDQPPPSQITTKAESTTTRKPSDPGPSIIFRSGGYTSSCGYSSLAHIRSTWIWAQDQKIVHDRIGILGPEFEATSSYGS